MKCIVCYLHPYFKNNRATMVVNGHSVCRDHVPAARKSTHIDVVLDRMHSLFDFDGQSSSSDTP
jgi:hypothetical protein